MCQKVCKIINQRIRTIKEEGKITDYNSIINNLTFHWKDDKKTFINYSLYCLKRALTMPFRKDFSESEIKMYEDLIKDKENIIVAVNYSPSLRAVLRLPCSDQGLSKDLIIKGFREPSEVKLMIQELEDRHNVLDIGANLGYYVVLESLLTEGKIYAVEPNPLSFVALKKNAELNGIKNIEFINAGVGKENETLKFYISKFWNWSRFTKELNGSSEDIIQTCEIPIFSLDYFLKKYKIDLIRMDVEGYEKEILLNSKLIKKSKIKIFVEFHGNILNFKQRKEFVDWLNKNKLEIKYALESDKYSEVEVKKNLNPEKLLHTYTDICLVLER